MVITFVYYYLEVYSIIYFIYLKNNNNIYIHIYFIDLFNGTGGARSTIFPLAHRTFIPLSALIHFNFNLQKMFLPKNVMLNPSYEIEKSDIKRS